MILGNQVEWALHCMTVLSGQPADRRVSTKALATFHGVPKEYLSKSLQLLSAAGLVDSSLGPKGGYRLSRPAERVTFLEIVEAVEGDAKSFRCSEIRRNNPCVPRGAGPRVFTTVCGIAAVMNEADEAWRRVLRRKTLADIGRDLAASVPSDILIKSARWFEPGESSE